jgi:hypothetical protein
MTDSTGRIVLHALRCIGFAQLSRVADAAGLAEADAESELIDLAVSGLVTAEFGAWGISEAGRGEDARWTAEELAERAARSAVSSAFEKFMVLNPELLDLCSAWYMRTEDGMPAPNDHSPAELGRSAASRDRRYDAQVLNRFVDLDRRADPVCAELAEALPRFRRYRLRLTAALDLARSGALEHLADSMTSYHVVWFQLHEDLLATLGRARP